jgi:hypothetical protein
MFEFSYDQAAGLRSAIPVAPARMLPIAATAQPARGYELLCTLATRLAGEGQQVVIVDASAKESEQRSAAEGRHLGLLQVLRDPAVAGLGRPVDQSEWLVLPGARGLQALANTAAAAGPEVALSRLLVPFAAGTLVLLYGGAPALAALLKGTEGSVLVPLLAQPQASIDAYGSIKLLHAAGLRSALMPVADAADGEGTDIRRLQDTVLDCARRHLGLQLESWPETTWAHRALEGAMAAPQRQLVSALPGQDPHTHERPSRRVHAHFSWS